jgi:hypothetical protein
VFEYVIESDDLVMPAPLLQKICDITNMHGQGHTSSRPLGLLRRDFDPLCVNIARDLQKSQEMPGTTAHVQYWCTPIGWKTVVVILAEAASYELKVLPSERLVKTRLAVPVKLPVGHQHPSLLLEYSSRPRLSPPGSFA